MSATSCKKALRNYETLTDSTAPSNVSKAKKLCNCLKTNALLIAILVAIFAGLLVGGLIGGLIKVEPNSLAVLLVSLPGEIFLNMLKMLIIPIIMFSLISGIGSIDMKTSGSLGWRTVVYYLSTTISAAILGIILVVSIQPGLKVDKNCEQNVAVELNVCQNLTVAHSIADLFRNLFPSNIFEAPVFQVRTTCKYVSRPVSCQCKLKNHSQFSNMTDEDCNSGDTVLQYGLEHVATPNVLGIVVFSITIAIVLVRMGERGRRILDVVSTLNDAVITLIHVIMWYAPVGVFSLIVGQLMQRNDFAKILEELGYFVLTSFLGLGIHGLLVLPLIYLVVARRNPLKLVYGCLEALLTAFSTSSSTATLPITLRCLEEKMKFDNRVTRFMIPIGATINMDGTALYEAIVAVFIAQLRLPTPPDFGQLLLIMITSILAAVGAAPIPQAGLVTLLVVLTTVGLPTDDIALILLVDWLIDRFRTVLNVFGDCVGCGIVDRWSHKFLPEEPLYAPLAPNGNDTQRQSIEASDDTAATNEHEMNDEEFYLKDEMKTNNTQF